MIRYDKKKDFEQGFESYLVIIQEQLKMTVMIVKTTLKQIHIMIVIGKD